MPPDHENNKFRMSLLVYRCFPYKSRRKTSFLITWDFCANVCLLTNDVFFCLLSLFNKNVYWFVMLATAKHLSSSFKSWELRPIQWFYLEFFSNFAVYYVYLCRIQYEIDCSDFQMSVTSFLRRLSVDSDSPKSSRSSRESRDSRESPRHAPSRRSRLVASIDSARRRFSLQHCNDFYHHLQAVAMMRDPQRLDVGSLPDLQEVGDWTSLVVLKHKM